MRAVTKKDYAAHLVAESLGDRRPKRERDELLLLLGKSEEDYHQDRQDAQSTVDRVQLLDMAQGILAGLRSLQSELEALRGSLKGPLGTPTG